MSENGSLFNVRSGLSVRRSDVVVPLVRALSRSGDVISLQFGRAAMPRLPAYALGHAVSVVFGSRRARKDTSACGGGDASQPAVAHRSELQVRRAACSKWAPTTAWAPRTKGVQRCSTERPSATGYWVPRPCCSRPCPSPHVVI